MFDRISLDDDELILNAQSLDMEEVHAFLKAYGCHTPENLELIGTDLYLWESSLWDDGYVPFFASSEAMWHAIRTRSKRPEHVYIIGMDDDQQASVSRSLDLYFLLRETLRTLCHSEGDDRQVHKYIFFSSKESLLTKLEISYLMTSDELLAIDVSEKNLKDAQTMRSAVMADEDVHCEERRHVMRETLTDFLKDEKDCNIRLIMESVSKFYKKYNERYKVYVSKFSVNKILTEIESDCVNFLGKVQEAIMAQQTKAFAVPGGIVAAGAILRPATTAWDYLVILVGLFISTWMIVSLNNNVVSHINLLTEEFERSTKKYDHIVVGVEEIQEKIEESRKKLSTSSKSAKSRLGVLTRVCCLIFLLISAILLKRSLETI
ncbi:hypothetical protein [Pseudomonas gingeri]|uniref:hypothetical protein n=1 Tax=Pseudomonas gingeri TaxID=117681 RepID=UPI0015A1DB1D|nr:hypothetical protein [Pseudomonas gingeri]NWA05383.1 hypothetical protein [Pseudomonas gingeri]NWA17806.1 hypothetical protein [Pseudomonas gingeri]NWA57770.1 hypothetical protein [Pseudomonas gingeri]NWA98791.1 hypothetical protein [Pseudomonas gingeri]NWB05917.1 hypothetical protein [Pseudomonas gingeri]